MHWIRAVLTGNPVLGRHLGTAYTGGRIGSALLIVNMVLLATYVGVFVSFSETDSLAGADAAGNLLYFMHNAVLYALLAILVPIKVSGNFEGPRFDKAFDQVVATGVSPLTLLVGSWLSGLLYTAVLLVVTVPFAGVMVTLADVSPARILGGYAVQLVYANVIIAVTLAGSLFNREWLTAPAAILGFLIAGLIPVCGEPVRWGYPVLLAELTPTRFFQRQADPWAALDKGSWIVLAEWDPYLFGLAIPLAVFPWLLWGGIVAVATVACAVGAPSPMERGLNAFGSVSLPGDGKRRFLARLRGGLVRKVEVAFFYENRPRWLRNWSEPVRMLLTIVGVVLTWGFLQGFIYEGPPLPGNTSFYNDEFALTATIGSAVVLLLWIVAVCDPRYRVYHRHHVGRWQVAREPILHGCFLILVAAYLAVGLGLLQSVEHNVGAAARTGTYMGNLLGSAKMTAAQVELYLADGERLVLGLAVLCVNLYLVSRLASRLSNFVGLPRVSTMVILLAMLVAPMVLFIPAIRGGADVDLARTFAFSPYLFGDFGESRTDPGRSMVPWSRDERFGWYLTSHAVLAVTLMFTLALISLRRRRVLRRARSAVTAAATATALVLLCLTPAKVHAQNDPAPETQPHAPSDESPALVIERAYRGFGGASFSAGVDFVTVVVRNPGEETVRGTVQTQYFSRTRGAARPFEVPGGATRILRWRIRQTLNRYDLPSPETFRLLFDCGDQVITSGNLDLMRPSWDSWSGQQALSLATGVVVGPRSALAQGWLRYTFPEGDGALAPCPVEALPEHGTSYYGARWVVLTSADLTEWNPAQRNALFEYLRLGGTVILTGDLAAVSMTGTGVWEQILTWRPRSVPGASQYTITPVWFPEGQDLVTLPRGGGQPDLPILHMRGYGAGRLCHVSLPLSTEALRELPTDAALWKRLQQALPSSVHPVLPIGSHDPLHTDVTSMLLVVGFLFLYSLIFAIGLIFFFKGRRKQLLLFGVIAGVPVATLCLVPLVNASLHLRPSPARYTEVAYHVSGSSHGLLTSLLTVSSAGRQEHTVSLANAEPRMQFHTRRRRHIYYYASFQQYAPTILDDERFPLLPADSGRHECRFAQRPWSQTRAYLTGDHYLRHPVSGTAQVDLTARIFSYEIELTPEVDLDTLEIYLFRPDDHRLEQMSWSADGEWTAGPTLRGQEALDSNFMESYTTSGGTNRLRLFTDESQSVRLERNRTRGLHEHTVAVLSTQSPHPRMFAVWHPPQDQPLTLDLTSDDLVFERNVAPELLWSDHETAMRAGMLPRGYEKRDGAYYRSQIERRVVVEIPVTVTSGAGR